MLQLRVYSLIKELFQFVLIGFRGEGPSKVAAQILSQSVLDAQAEHHDVRVVDFPSPVSLLPPDNQELVNEHTEQYSVDDRVQDVDRDHDAHLCVCSSVHFYHHKGEG